MKINFTVNTDTRLVILHSKNHVFTSVSLKNLRNPTDQISEDPAILACDSNEMVSFNFNKRLEKGHKYELAIVFSGNLTYSLGGFYLSKYKKKDGKETVIGTTQFESIDARQAFPCFDEPSFKVSLVEVD